MSDNAMISVYPFGDEIYAFTEAPVIHRYCFSFNDFVTDFVNGGGRAVFKSGCPG